MLELLFFFMRSDTAVTPSALRRSTVTPSMPKMSVRVYIALRGSCVIRPELNPFFHSMNNDVQVQLLIAI